MPTHIWVTEVLKGGKWHFLVCHKTRHIARHSKKFVFTGTTTRILKYVPA